MNEEKKRLAGLARGIQGLRRQARDLRKEVDFLDRFSARLPSSACAAARSYLTMIEHGADLTLAQVTQLRAELARREAETKIKRMAARFNVEASGARRAQS